MLHHPLSPTKRISICQFPRNQSHLKSHDSWEDGNCHQILFDADAEKWKIIHQETWRTWLGEEKLPNNKPTIWGW